MFYIQLHNICKAFSEHKPLINKLNITVSQGNVLGIVGRNGEGKTSLLKILAGELLPDSGQVILSRQDLTIGYHTQFLNIFDNEELTIEEYIFKSFVELNSLYIEIRTLSNAADPNIDRLLELQTQFDEMGGYQVWGEIETSLISLGLSQFNLDTQIQNLSGGQKTRLQLAKILIQSPDILLLDEPTNHLDEETINWLVNYIHKRVGITIIVSHDRKFLNKAVTHILEIEKGTTKLYTGNYDDFYNEKQKNIERDLEDIKQSNRKIGKLEEVAHSKASLAIKQHYQRPDKKKYGRNSRTIMRNKAGKKLRDVKMIQKRIDSKIDHNMIIAPKTHKTMSFAIHAVGSVGNFVLKIRNLDINIAGKKLINSISLDILKADRVAIVGANGTGKTTLIKKIVEGIGQGIESIKVGNDIRIGYYSQEHEEINLDLKVLDAFRESIMMSEVDAANYLHKMLFTYEQLKQKVRDISQGEKSKLALAKLLASKHNLLILDEPTNHLDIASREILEVALNMYEGSLLVISHDAFFLKKIGANKTYEIVDKNLEPKNITL